MIESRWVACESSFLVKIVKFSSSRVLFTAFLFAATCCGGSSLETARNYDDLLAGAEANGTVRVIVRVKMPGYKLEGELPNQDAIDTQRKEIARVQDSLLERLAPYKVSNVKKFKGIPYVALEVDLEGLKYLISDPDVLSIEGDAIAQLSS